jgi:hypothetical protein
MTELCNERCENCEHVNRGVDETAHIYYQLSERCPFYVTLEIYRANHCRPSIELVTQWTGCKSFVLDEQYKKQCDEFEAYLDEKYKQQNRDDVK